MTPCQNQTAFLYHVISPVEMFNQTPLSLLLESLSHAVITV